MPSWNEVLKEIDGIDKDNPIDVVRRKYLSQLHKHTGRNVIAYYSAFLQHPGKMNSNITDDDKNGFMNCIHKMDCSKGLDLILHTPGGDIAATESLVSYLRAKFGNNIRAIIPQLAMSAGTMIACACNEIVMGKQSSLGPFDPQFGGIPAYGVLEEFEKAKNEIIANPKAATYWQFIIGKYHPTFIGQCEKAIKWSGKIVKDWLITGMLKEHNDPEKVAENIVSKLNNHEDTFSHNRHFDIQQLKEIELRILELEEDQKLQDLVLTIHHCYMHVFGGAPIIKAIENHMHKGMFYRFTN